RPSRESRQLQTTDGIAPRHGGNLCRGSRGKQCFDTASLKASRDLLLRQRFAYGFLEVFPAQIFAQDISLVVEQISRRVAIDSVFGGQFVAPTLSIEKLLPGHALLLGKASELQFILIQADTDDLES